MDDSTNAYLLQRQENIERNQSVLRALQLERLVVKPVRVPRVLPRAAMSDEPTRASSRLEGTPRPRYTEDPSLASSLRGGGSSGSGGGSRGSGVPRFNNYLEETAYKDAKKVLNGLGSPGFLIYMTESKVSCLPRGNASRIKVGSNRAHVCCLHGL